MPESVAVEVVEELSESEERDRLYLERRVERAVFDGARALRELRDRRLYRSTHSTFEEYCQERFGYKRRHSYQLIDAANVVDNLMATEDEKMCANGAQNETGSSSTSSADLLSEEEAGSKETKIILPTSERQVRDIAKLSPEQQREVWQQAVAEAGGKVPSNRIVKDVVQRIREKTPVPNPYRVGEVCQIIALDNPDLKRKGGCWCIVSQVHQWGCTVNTWDVEAQVRLEHLKSLDYSQEERQQMESRGVRMTQLHETGRLDEAALWVLKGLGKLTRPYLIPLEEKLLRVLESEYGLVR